VVRTSEGSYTMVGQTFSFGVGGDAWLIKTDVEEELGLAWTDSTANTITCTEAETTSTGTSCGFEYGKSISLS
jgi:hypothetical protein